MRNSFNPNNTCWFAQLVTDADKIVPDSMRGASVSYIIEQVWMNVYHGGTAVSPYDQHLYVDNVVVARQYIGPMNADLPDEAGPPGPDDPGADSDTPTDAGTGGGGGCFSSVLR